LSGLEVLAPLPRPGGAGYIMRMVREHISCLRAIGRDDEYIAEAGGFPA